MISVLLQKYEERNENDLNLYESCLKDDGRPIGIGVQASVSNHPKLHRLRVVVVSVGGKVWSLGIRAGECQRDERKQTFR